LENIAEDIGKFGLISAIIILCALILRFCAEESEKPEGSQFGSSYSGGYIIRFLLVAITIVVVAISKGHPLAITLSLAFLIKKILYD
jgi:magnesium-transporting ATPase (P-type)